MAPLEKFFCLFALILSLLMSMVLGVVVCSVPVPRTVPAAEPVRTELLQQAPLLEPRAPGADPSEPESQTRRPGD